MIRTLLLWASKNAFLRKWVPRFRAVRWVLAKYMPGEDLGSALDAAADLAKQEIAATFTHLGENVEDLAQARRVTQDYLDALDQVAERGLDAEISVKLTHLGLDIDVEEAFRGLVSLAEHARQLGNWVWVDMESTEYVDRTVEIYRRVRRDLPNVGICLQAYLRRTAADVRGLASLSPAVRLVKGAYREPPSLVFRSRRGIDRSYTRLAIQILEASRDHPIRLALGTHDVPLIERVYAAALARGLPTDGVEVQMLYGVRSPDQLRFAHQGRPTRVLIAYGSYWYPWFMRRLAERPANALLVVRGILETSRKVPTEPR